MEKIYSHDLITMGRSSIDLYSNDLGKPFSEIKNFGAYLGGSPLNIAVGASRLGLKTALLTAVGQDQPGDFILSGLQREKVDTAFVPRKPEARSSAVLLAIQPPDKFPITFYRENAADIQLSIDDVLNAPITTSRVVQLSGTALSKDPSRSAVFLAAERAQAAGATVYLDIDFRANQWHDVRAFGLYVRAILPMIDVAIGTVEEINAAMLQDPADITIRDSQITAPEIRGDTKANIAALLERLPAHGVLVVKTGEEGCVIHQKTPTGLEVISVPGFPVEVVSVLGAGDAFAAGLITGRVWGWDWYKSARLGNACGAIVVTQVGCSQFAPNQQEVLDFIASKGGF